MKQRGFSMSRRLFAFSLLVACSIVSRVHGDIWISGHGDIGVGLENNQLHLHLHFEDTVAGASGPIAAGEYESTDHIVGVPNPPVARPTGTDWNFLGDATSIWFLPQSSNSAKPYMGFGLEELTGPLAGDWSGPLTWSLTSVVTAPAGANVSIWQTNPNDPFGPPSVKVATSDGLTAADSFTQSAGGHEHFNVGFTREGAYELQFRIQGTHNTLGVLSDTAIYSFQVGTITAVPEPSSIALVFAAMGVGGWCIRRRSQAVLTNNLPNT
jgi:surface-anchored protein